MGLLTCECDHLRTEHLGGNDYDSDSKVLRCQHENCTCKHYRPDEKTRKIKNEVYLSSMVLPLIIAIGSVALGVSLHFGMESVLNTYSITNPETEKIFYANGTEVQQSTIDPKGTILFVNDSFLGVTLFAVNYGLLLFYYGVPVQNRLRELR
jgi:hypothetical protein